MRLVYVSPLKALSYDIERNCGRHCAGIGADISVGLRTGNAAARAAGEQKKPPDILITTPESST